MIPQLMVKKPKPKVEKKPKPKSVHDRFMNSIKGEILKRGLSNYRIAQDTGISAAALSRFSKPGGTIKAESLFVLLDYLDVALFQHRDGYVLSEETYNDLMEAVIQSQIHELQKRMPGHGEDE
jgi:hypothetical protein